MSLWDAGVLDSQQGTLLSTQIPTHPSSPMVTLSNTSIVCTLILTTSQSHQKQNLKSVLSLSLPPSFLPLPPWYVCVYLCEYVCGFYTHVLLSHACSEDEGGCHMSLPILLITLRQDFPLNSELFRNPESPSNPSGLSPTALGLKEHTVHTQIFT